MSFTRNRQVLALAVVTALLSLIAAPCAFGGKFHGNELTGKAAKQHREWVAKEDKKVAQARKKALLNKENKKKNVNKAKDAARKAGSHGHPFR